MTLLLTVAGYLAALLIGVSLGLIGGGGSILTVPLLVYGFGVAPLVATSWSLLVVGSTSLAGAALKYRRGEVDLRTALTFGAASLAVVLVMRRFVMPAIPDDLFTLGGFTLTKSLFTLLAFAALMVLSAVKMLWGAPPVPATDSTTANPMLQMALRGAVVGVVTGFVGAGGGFLIIPALVLFARLPMKQAVGTSLLIIAVNSLLGFLADLGRTPLDGPLLSGIIVAALAGMLLGNFLAAHIDGNRLKKAFGWFVLTMGLFIFLKEMFLS